MYVETNKVGNIGTLVLQTVGETCIVDYANNPFPTNLKCFKAAAVAYCERALNMKQNAYLIHNKWCQCTYVVRYACVFTAVAMLSDH